jgi:hypothetical protein
MDIVAQRFEIGQSSQGITALQQWIASQVSGGLATNLLGTVIYKDFEQDYILALMATHLTKAEANAVGPFVAAASFDIRNDGGVALVNWLNTQQIGVAAPVAPTLSLLAAGVLTGQGSPSVKIALVTPNGLSAASAAATVAVTDDHELVVASPAADSAKLATGYNVYIGAAGSEKLQNVTPIALGTNFTLITAPTTTGVVASATNATGAKYLQSLNIRERTFQKIVTVVVSN